MTVDHAIAVANGLGVLFSLFVAIIYGHKSWTYWRSGECGLVQQLSLGIALVAVAWAVHRGYYGLWRAGRVFEAIPAYQIDAAAEVAMLATGVTVAGYAAHIYAASRPWLAYAAMAAGVVIVALAFIVP